MGPAAGLSAAGGQVGGKVSSASAALGRGQPGDLLPGWSTDPGTGSMGTRECFQMLPLALPCLTF